MCVLNVNVIRRVRMEGGRGYFIEIMSFSKIFFHQLHSKRAKYLCECVVIRRAINLFKKVYVFHF